MKKKNNEFLPEQYHEKLLLAKGDLSINAFAKLAGISPGNYCRMLAGQLAVPKTLKKIADARPDLELIYNELMYAAGYFTSLSSNFKVNSESGDSVGRAYYAVPVISSLEGRKSSIINRSDNEKLLFSKNELTEGQYFVFENMDDGLAPCIKIGDMLLFDAKKKPKDGDIVLLRVKKHDGIIRYYREVNSKIIASGSSPSFQPNLFNKAEVDVMGVAVKAIVNL